ncbi:hypothetical protein LINGRAHAP2_LOCUS14664, partial [Linum grandiflorum]
EFFRAYHLWHKCEAVVKVAATTRNRGRQFYRRPYWQDKTADCKFFRWASDGQQTAEESFVGESSMGVYNPNAKFDDRESLTIQKVHKRVLWITIPLGIMLYLMS